jgi:threonine/homoserine/homoserine lactone efflux protein
MPSIATLGAFALTAFVIIVIPGPSVLFAIGRSLALGRRAGFLSVLGNSLGIIPLVAAVALGLGFIVAQSVVLFTVIKLVGALYIMYLGVQAIRHRKDGALTAVADGPKRSAMRMLGQGFFVGISNPKLLVFFVAVLPQFVNFHAGAVPLQMLMLGVVFFVIAVLSDSTWVVLAALARGWFTKSPKNSERLSATGGVVLIGLGGVLALTGNKS